jgi:hypothetical protein
MIDALFKQTLLSVKEFKGVSIRRYSHQLICGYLRLLAPQRFEGVISECCWFSNVSWRCHVWA